MDRVLSGIGFPGWFRHAYFEYHPQFRLRNKLASGLGGPWTRDGGIPQGCPLSMMFIVALYLPWCRYLAAHEGVQPQLYADNLKCVSGDPDLLLHAARFTTAYVGLVGQEPAPSKRVFLSTSAAVRKDMKNWLISDGGDRWSVDLDVRDFGGHLDATYRSWVCTLAARVREVLKVVWLVSPLPLDFEGKHRILRTKFIPTALHGIEASLLSQSSYLRLRAAFVRACWSSKMSMSHSRTVLSLLDGPEGVDPEFCIVWFRFRLMRRYLAYRPEESARIGRLLDLVSEGAPGHGPVHLLVRSAAKIGFKWCSEGFCWDRPGLPRLPFLEGPFNTSSLLLLMLGKMVSLLTSAVGRGFGEVLFWILVDPCNCSSLLMSGVETRRCLEGSFLGVYGMVFSSARGGEKTFLVVSVVGLMETGICFWDCDGSLVVDKVSGSESLVQGSMRIFLVLLGLIAGGRIWICYLPCLMEEVRDVGCIVLLKGFDCTPGSDCFACWSGQLECGKASK